MWKKNTIPDTIPDDYYTKLHTGEVVLPMSNFAKYIREVKKKPTLTMEELFYIACHEIKEHEDK